MISKQLHRYQEHLSPLSMKQQLENQKEVLLKEAMPSALGQVFLWENNTALQGLDACLSLLFSYTVAR